MSTISQSENYTPGTKLLTQAVHDEAKKLAYVNPAISIVVPTFNRTEILFETLESVRCQTRNGWECIIVDDGSKETHVEAIERWIDADPRFRLIRRQSARKGAPACRNIGWRHAKANYVVFLDSDDLLANNCVEYRIKATEMYPELGFLVFSTLLFKDRAGDRTTLVNVMTTEDPVSRYLKMDVIWLAAGVLWHKATLERLGGWDEGQLSWQDWDLSLRALLDGCAFRYFSEVDNFWRVKDSQRECIGHQAFSPEHMVSHEKLVLKICDLVRKNPAHLRLASCIYFWIACKWLAMREQSYALQAWSKARPGVSKRDFYFSKGLLVIAWLIPFRKRLLKFAENHNYPGPMLWQGSFNRVTWTRPFCTPADTPELASELIGSDIAVEHANWEGISQ